jgi:hypothetical protein
MSSRPGIRAASVSDCRDEVQAVLASRVFRHAEQLSKLLEYICDNALLGQAENLTEYTIAMDVFGKPEGFRENRDSSVRVDVHRLRKRLGAFYAQEGTGHKLRIVIPPGSYVPEFRVAEESAEEPAVVAAAPPAKQEPGHRRLRTYIFGGLAVVLALAVALAAAWLVMKRQRFAAGSAAAATNAPPVAATNREVHILAGYTRDPWTDATGHIWQADRYFRGGISRPGPPNLRSAPPDRRLFLTMREGATEAPEDRAAFSYDIPMQPGTYELLLYFADPLGQNPQNGQEDNENVRRFTIHANGRALIEQFDAISDAGYADVDVRVFKDISPGADGLVHLEFIPEPYQPFVNAIEMVPCRPGHANPIRVAAGATAPAREDGKTFGPDGFFLGGRLVEHAIPADIPNPPALLRKERYGNFSYAIPAPPGSYTLTLYFAETIFSPTAPPSMCRGEGCRVFDVTCNGGALLRDFDVYRAAGGAFRVISRSFHGLHPNAQGKLLVSFTPSVNYAEVRAIEVLDEAP